jgi:hypothetical protein
MAIDNRVTIFTQPNSTRYGSRALVLDLSRNISHDYGTTVAKHPIEGSASGVSDHSYLKNIKIGVSGHVSDAVPIVSQSDTDSFQPYALNRDDNAYIGTVQEALNNVILDQTEIENISTGVPLTLSQAAVMTKYVSLSNVEGIEFVEGQLVNNVELGVATFWVEDTLDALVTYRNSLQETKDQKQEEVGEKNLNIVYSRSTKDKQKDALELLEAIYSNRILVDVLTPVRLYENMVMADLKLPRTSGAGQALEIRATFEQQSFVSAYISTTTISVATSANSDDISTQKNQGKKQGSNFELTDATRKLAEKAVILKDVLLENE